MTNKLGITGYDYVEFYVGSGKMNAFWFAKALGMNIEGYMGPETGVRDRASYYLTQGDFKIVVTAGIQPGTHEVNSFVVKHGDGVKRWAVRVDDVEAAYRFASDNGQRACFFPRRQHDCVCRR